MIYFQLLFENQSPVDYDIEVLRFFIRDRKKGKRTTIQENELKPLYVTGNARQGKANSRTAIVVPVEKFTIPNAKYLAIQVMEKNGGRHVHIKVSIRKILQGRVLPDLK